MKSRRTKLSAGEWDAFSKRSRRVIVWHKGETAGIKRRFNRRMRRIERIRLLYPV